MTVQALYNLQRGGSENKLYPQNNYTPESSFDRYVLAKVATRDKYRLIIDKEKQDEYENNIANNMAKKIEKLVTDIFK